MQTTTSLSGFLDRLASDLSDILRRAARAAERIADPELSLPPILRIRDIAAHRGCSNTTAWRKARLGRYGRPCNKPGEPFEITREEYLRNLQSEGS